MHVTLVVYKPRTIITEQAMRPKTTKPCRSAEEAHHIAMAEYDRRRMYGLLDAVLRKSEQPAAIESATRHMHKASVTTRNAGKLTPLNRRVVMLGSRGGLYEMRPKFESSKELQRVSLLPRDQARCEAGSLPGAKGVCGYVERADKTRHSQEDRKSYGGYRLKDDVPESVKEWTRATQRAVYDRQHIPRPPQVAQ